MRNLSRNLFSGSKLSKWVQNSTSLITKCCFRELKILNDSRCSSFSNFILILNYLQFRKTPILTHVQNYNNLVSNLYFNLDIRISSSWLQIFLSLPTSYSCTIFSLAVFSCFLLSISCCSSFLIVSLLRVTEKLWQKSLGKKSIQKERNIFMRLLLVTT